MNKNQVIVFKKNEKDEYFRKSTEFAAADVVLKDDVKSSGSVERLSATILKGVQDQLFSIARQKHIELVSKNMTEIFSTEYKQLYIDGFMRDAKKADKTKGSERLLEEASKSYELKKMSLDRLAEKEAWKNTIRTEVKDDELIFRFDAKSILEYANVNGGRKDRLYQDVKKIQQRFNNWTEKKLDESGKIVDREITGVLFPYSEYTHGAHSTIEIKLSKELLHCVLFLNKNFLKYHLESYIKVETPNATRLYELLVDTISGNIFVSGRPLTFDYLQKRFNTSYKHFFHFSDRLINPSLEKINNELGTSIQWVVDKKKGKSIESIKFVISEYDRKVLQGIRDEDVDETILCSFEFYLALVSLGGQKAQGGLRSLYEKIRGEVNDGTFGYFGKTREEMLEEHFKNIEDAEELEGIVEGDNVLQQKYMYSANYLNIIDREDMTFAGATATESLEYIRTSYLIPKGFLSPILPYFDSYDDERNSIKSVLPIKFKMTEKKKLLITEDNFDSIKATIEPHIGSTERFEFDSQEHKQRYCAIFGIVDEIAPLEAIEATIVESEEFSMGGSFARLEDVLIGLENTSIQKSKEKWVIVFDSLLKEYGEEAADRVVRFISSEEDEAGFWLKNITTPGKLQKHFAKILQICNVNHSSLLKKIKVDPEIQRYVNTMKDAGRNEEEIAVAINVFVANKIEKGLYEQSASEPQWIKEKREKREEGEAIHAQVVSMGFANLLDYLKNR